MQKTGTLIADVDEETLKKILIKNVVTNRFGEENGIKAEKIKKLRTRFEKKNKKEENK